jgi:hypothetical protein
VRDERERDKWYVRERETRRHEMERVGEGGRERERDGEREGGRGK